MVKSTTLQGEKKKRMAIKFQRTERVWRMGCEWNSGFMPEKALRKGDERLMVEPRLTTKKNLWGSGSCGRKGEGREGEGKRLRRRK